MKCKGSRLRAWTVCVHLTTNGFPEPINPNEHSASSFTLFRLSEFKGGCSQTLKNMAEEIQKKLTLNVYLSIHKQEVITSTIHKFTDKYFVSQNKVDNVIQITFTAKPEQSVSLELLAKDFENELIDQQVRYDTEQKFGEIRNLIVQQAFAPIN
jgi:His-Xaa-Ser system protein HxsD